jgi:hypothetical protein
MRLFEKFSCREYMIRDNIRRDLKGQVEGEY